MDNLTKTIINEILDHGDDDYANRIREKEESLSNTKRHCINIPLAKLNNDLNDMIYGADNELADPYVVTVEYDNTSQKNEYQDPITSLDNYNNVQNDVDNIKQGIINYEPTTDVNDEDEIADDRNADENAQIVEEEKEKEKSPLFTIVNRNLNLIIGNYAKPINVKDHMLLNFKRKSNISSFSEVKKPTSIYVEENLEDTYEIPILNMSQKNLYINDKQFANINQIYNELNIEKQKSLDILKQFDDITSAVRESDKVIQILANKDKEEEEQLKNLEMRSYEMEQEIIDVLNSKRDRIAGVTKEKKDLIDNASKQMEENNERIIDYQEKISATVQKKKEVNMRIAQQEELLKSLRTNDNIFEFDNYNEENKSRKVA